MSHQLHQLDDLSAGWGPFTSARNIKHYLFNYLFISRVTSLQHFAATRQHRHRNSEVAWGHHQILIRDRLHNVCNCWYVAALTNVLWCRSLFVKVCYSATFSSAEAVQHQPGWATEVGTMADGRWDQRQGTCSPRKTRFPPTTAGGRSGQVGFLDEGHKVGSWSSPWTQANQGDCRLQHFLTVNLATDLRTSHSANGRKKTRTFPKKIIAFYKKAEYRREIFCTRESIHHLRIVIQYIVLSLYCVNK